MLPLALSALMTQQFTPRFESYAPLPTVPPVTIDMAQNGIGIAQQTARSRNLQARILWIDATANIDRYNTEAKIVDLVARIADAGFNTFVLDVKPISGQVIYPSRLAPKLQVWREKTLPDGFDPIPIFLRQARKVGLAAYASLNAFSEGHRMFKVGPGYERLSQQTILYDAVPTVRLRDASFPFTWVSNRLFEDKVSGFTSIDRVPVAENAFFAVLDRNRDVIATFDKLGFEDPRGFLPRGASVIGGLGPAGQWLRQHAQTGMRVNLDTEARYVPISERPEEQIPLMMNPNDPAVRKNSLEILRELVGKYAFDGIIYDDRLRYAGMNADFSDETRRQFEQIIGRSLRWPDDVFHFSVGQNFTKGVEPGPLFDQWLSFRSQTMRSYVREAKGVLQAVRPGTQIGVYAGSWYGEYPALGNNWASDKFEAGFPFLTNNYRATGFASDLDFLITGCYYPTATIAEAMERNLSAGFSVEAAGNLTNRAVRDACWSYAGIALSDFKQNPDGLTNALQAALSTTQGVMVFDLSHEIEPMWPVFKRAFSMAAMSPNQRPNYLAEVRRKRKIADEYGEALPPVVIAPGASGTGQ